MPGSCYARFSNTIDWCRTGTASVGRVLAFSPSSESGETGVTVTDMPRSLLVPSPTCLIKDKVYRSPHILPTWGPEALT